MSFFVFPNPFPTFDVCVDAQPADVQEDPVEDQPQRPVSPEPTPKEKP